MDRYVRRYFSGSGWFNGKVTVVRVGEFTGEKLYTVYYSEDSDMEDLNQLSFEEGREYYNQVPQPTLPIELVRLQGASTENPVLTPHVSQLASPPLIASSNLTARKYSSDSTDSSTSSLSSSPSHSPKALSEEKDESDAHTELSPCAGCGNDVSPHYKCPSCNRSLHHFCGTRPSDRSDSPPTHGDPTWCKDCKPSKSAPAAEDETKVYSGQGSGDGVAMTICLANNPGLGFTNQFQGISSFESMVNEAKKRNNGQTIETHNNGAWLSVPAQAAKETVFLFPTMNFSTDSPYIPKLSLLNNTICRRVDCHSGAFGEDFIPEASEDVQVAGPKKKRNGLVNDDVDLEVADGGKSFKKSRVRKSGSAGKSARRHSSITADVKSVAAEWNVDDESNFNEVGDMPLLPVLHTKLVAKVVAPQDVSEREEQQQNRRQTSTALMGMSPDSVKVRMDSAANAARNELHERFHIDSQQREDFSRQREREQDLRHL